MKRFKSLIAGIFIFLAVISMSKVVHCEESNIDIYINGKQVTFYTKPTIKNNVILVPLDELFKNLFFDRKEVSQISNWCKEKKIGEFINNVQMVPVKIVNNYNYINTSINGNRIDFQVDKFKISFINQLNGKSIYIKNNDYDVLINAGNELDNKRMEAFLNDNVYDKLDLVVATDFDKNHIGGIPFVVNNEKYSIDQFLYPKDDSNDSLNTVYYEKMIDGVLKKKITSTQVIDKENKVYQLGENGYLEIENINGKIVCKIKQGNKQILLLNNIEKSSQYYLVENEKSSDIIQIDESNELLLPLLRKTNPEEILIYEYNNYSNDDTQNYIKDNIVKVDEVNTKLDYAADITIENGKFVVNHKSYNDNNVPDKKYIKLIPIVTIFILVIIVFMNIFEKSNKIAIKDNVFSKFKDLLKFKVNNKLLSVFFYLMFIVFLLTGIVLELQEQESISNNINHLRLICMVAGVLIIYCIIVISIIFIEHVWQYISKDLYESKEINKEDRVFFNIFSPILVIAFYYIFFELIKEQFDLAIYEKIYIILALILTIINFVTIFKGIIVTMSSNILLSSSEKIIDIKLTTYGKIIVKDLKKKLLRKLFVIFTWFIIIYLNCVAFLYIISKIANNSFIETLTQKSTDLLGIFYLTIITLFTVGYGDIIPVGTFARLGIIFVILIGSFFTLLAIGKIFSMEDEA